MLRRYTRTFTDRRVKFLGGDVSRKPLCVLCSDFSLTIKLFLCVWEVSMGRVLQIYGSEGQERMTHIMFSPLSMTLFFVIVHYVDGDVLAKMLVTRMDGC